MEKFTMAGGTALRYSDTLRGDRVVVLLHGYLESLDVWDDLVKLLRKEFRVIAPDLPGHGISEVKGEVHTMEFLADTVHDLIQGLGVDRYLVAGHSMGGYAALEIMRKYPETLCGLVLLHSTPNADSDQKKEMRFREITLIDEGKKEVLARMSSEKGFAPENRKAMQDRIEEMFEQATLTEDEGIKAILRGMGGRRDNNEAMRTSEVPQLLVLGRHDEYITPETAEKLIAAQPQAGVAWMERSGHMSYMEEPENCARAIIDFAKEAE